MKLYHGSNIPDLDFTDPEQSVVPESHREYGDALAYFTDCQDSAIRYATSMTATEGGKACVYSAYINTGECFDLDAYYTTDRLVEIIDGIDLRLFGKGLGILNSYSDEYAMISSLRYGKLKLTGKEIFKGLSFALESPSAALYHIVDLGYDCVKFKCSNIGMKPHTIYLVDDAEKIQLIDKKAVQHTNVYGGSAYDSRLLDDDYSESGDQKMILQYIRNIAHSINEMYELIESGQDVPAWGKKKIILAEDYLDTVRDYMNSKR